MKTKRGFTLVELLVVIVILGIIIGLSIPLIRNIRQGNEDKEYGAYRDSITQSAKLYIDSYSEDLFGHQSSGCVVIRYDQLKEKGLVKDISINDISCESEQTYVRVVKSDGKYIYATNIGCGSVQADGTVKVVTHYPEETVDIEACGVSTSTSIGIYSTPANAATAISYKSRNVYVNVKSPTGIRDSVDIKAMYIPEAVYQAHKDELDQRIKNPKDYYSEGEWILVRFRVPDATGQRRTMAQGKLIKMTSIDAVTTPDGQTGVYRLVVRVDTLTNLEGTPWREDSAIVKYAYLGAYQIDNQKPEFNASEIISSSTEYNSLTPKLNLKATDNLSSSSDMKMCVVYGTETCSTKVSDIKNLSGSWETYSPNKVLGKIHNTYDGSTHTIHVYVADAAGNVIMKDYSYQVAYRYTLTYHANGGVECNPTTKSHTYNSDTTVTWGTLCSPTRAGYAFTGWNTKEDGSGDTITSSTSVTQNLDVYAQWRPYVCTITYHPNGGTFGAHASDTTQTCAYNGNNNCMSDMRDASGGYYAATKDGYSPISGKEWIVSGETKTFNQAQGYKATDFCTDLTTGDRSVTLKVNWDVITYTISYDLNDGSVSPANPGSYTVTTPNFTLKNPTKDGYIFTGWTGTGLSSATTTVTIPKGSTGNRSYTANWKSATFNITYDLAGGSVSGNPSTYTETTATFTLKNPTKDGYNFAGWTGTGLSSATTTVTIPKGSSGDRSYTATWTKASYAISYNLAGGSVSGNPTTYNIDTATFTLKNPTRSGYEFKGWTGTGLSAATTTVTITKGSTGDRSYTATWRDNVAPTCTLKVTTSGVQFANKSSDVTAFGINKSTTASYGGNTSLALAEATFYGHVKDGGENTGRCKATVKKTTPKCPDGYSVCGDSNTSCSYPNCYARYVYPRNKDTLCRGASVISGSYCYFFSGNNGYQCSSGYTKLNNSWCYKIG